MVMNVMKLILDSFSSGAACFGSTNYEGRPVGKGNDNCGSRPSTSSPPTLPMDVSSEDSGLVLLNDQDSQQDDFLLKGGCCSELPQQYKSAMLLPESERDRSAHFLAQASKKIAVASRSSVSPSPYMREVSYEKARHKSNRRKMEIFRKEQKPYSFSTFLEPHLLCFANPVFDSVDDDTKLYRDDYAADEETIDSTTYFDAKYEHVVEVQHPIPLFMEFSVPCDSACNDNLIHIFNTGSHQTTSQSTYWQDPPPPPPAMMSTSTIGDSTSSSEDSF